MSDGAVEGSRSELVRVVQLNCDIADARHAADLTLCTYLLQMREFFRWERGLPFGATLARDEVGGWIAAREQHWDTLLDRPFLPLALTPGAAPVDPFDVETMNAGLMPLGLLYGAGVGPGARPVFFLARCHSAARRDGLRVLQAGKELARGLAAPPAVLAGGADGPIVLRRESIARMGWERFEAFGLRPSAGSAFAHASRAYGFDIGFDHGLGRWLEDQVELATLHELGEHAVGHRLGPAWTDMRLSLPSRRAELLAVAVRDHLADLLVTLPTLLDRAQAAALHAWFSGLDGLRASLFPALARAYAAWLGSGDDAALRCAVAAGRAHFEALAGRLLALQACGAGGQAMEAVLTADTATCRRLTPAARARACT